MIRLLLAGTAASALTVAAAGVALPSAPVARPTWTELDSLRLLQFRCAGGRDRAALLQTRLELASTVSIPAASAEPPPLMAGLEAVHRPVRTRSQMAQRYFDQGLALTYGFNHDAAVAAFRAAQRLDPDCAMCFWGEAYARGPNINAAMAAEANGRALAAVGRAMTLREGASPVERALIEALATRYSGDPGAERAHLDNAYAAAMEEVARRFPADDDVAVLAAEAVMDTQPWDYWETDRRTPKEDIVRAITAVEQVLARNPDHPQAIHLYIHLMEASAMPERAEAAADRLARPLAPGAGHLVHMPGHLYFRLGRYKDAIAVNLAAARADEDYLRAAGDRGSYRYSYYPHNVHFIVTSAQMGGDAATALDQSRRLQSILGIETALALPWVQVIYAAPSFVHAQFSAPEAILRQPQPDPRLPYVQGMWRYSRAVAHALRRDERAFAAEVAELRRVRDTADFTALTAGGVPAADLLQLAEEVAHGRLAYAQGRFEQAASRYRAAIAIEDRIPYMEPPYWYFPVRQSLGAAQLAAGDPAGARQTFVEALARSPNNGWALHGLAEAERRLGDRAGRDSARAAFRRAWLGGPAAPRLDRL
jgi:tetratricopeptide (TPR) repeat protein